MLYITALLLYGQSQNQNDSGFLDAILFGVWIFAFGIVGLIVYLQRPGHPVAWLCLVFALVWGIWVISNAFLAFEAAHPGTVPNPPLIAALAYPLWVPGVGSIAALLLVFPSGRLPSPKWRVLGWTLTGTVVALTVTAFFLPGIVQDTSYVNPLGIEFMEPFRTGAPSFALVSLLVACLVGSAVSVVVRFRGAAGIERLQLKWLVAAGTVSALSYGLIFFVEELPIQLVWSAIPIAIGLSMHRHRLYDVDRLISRTVTYGLVVAILAAAYLGVVFVLGNLLPLEGDLAVAASTLAVAGLFNPVRKAVQVRVDHRFNRSRYDAQRVFEEFEETLRTLTDPGGVVNGWVGVVARTMKPASVSIWLPGPRQ